MADISIEAKEIEPSDRQPATYYRSACEEIDTFLDATGRTSFRARTESGRQFLLSAPLAEILRNLDGTLGPQEVADALARGSGLRLTPKAVHDAIRQHLAPRGLVRLGAAEDENARTGDRKHRRFGGKFDFVFRLPLIGERLSEPVCSRLKFLLRMRTVPLCLLLILLGHLYFYSLPLKQRLLPSTASQITLIYALVLVTVVFHEFGHATACRYYNCHHGEIGFCLYLIFPAFYVDLSRAWALSGKRRAVIDVGGVYFHLLTVPFLCAIYALTHNRAVASTIYSVDTMALLAMNPLFKSDGYWLLVDLAGFPNLQTRSIAFLREVFNWPRNRQAPASLCSVTGWVRKTLLVLYATMLGSGMAIALPLLIRSFPARMRQVWIAAGVFHHSLSGDPARATIAFGSLLTQILFLIFVLQSVRMILSRFVRRPSYQSSASTAIRNGGALNEGS